MADAPNRLPNWIIEHLRAYRASNGAEGHIWNGVPCLLLTTKGRRSGVEQTLPLIYGTHGANYLIVASKGGAPTHPAWYFNVLADPTVTVEVGTDSYAARAEVLAGAERDAAYARQAAIFTGFADYQKKTTRVIPVIRLARHQ